MLMSMVISLVIAAVLWWGISLAVGLVVGVTMGDGGIGILLAVNVVALAVIQAMQLVVLAAVGLEFDEHADESVSGGGLPLWLWWVETGLALFATLLGSLGGDLKRLGLRARPRALVLVVALLVAPNALLVAGAGSAASLLVAVASVAGSFAAVVAFREEGGSGGLTGTLALVRARPLEALVVFVVGGGSYGVLAGLAGGNAFARLAAWAAASMLVTCLTVALRRVDEGLEPGDRTFAPEHTPVDTGVVAATTLPSFLRPAGVVEATAPAAALAPAPAPASAAHGVATPAASFGSWMWCGEGGIVTITATWSDPRPLRLQLVNPAHERVELPPLQPAEQRPLNLPAGWIWIEAACPPDVAQLDVAFAWQLAHAQHDAAA
ncbi:MAG: hypothetical protein JWN72_904 [Thermoleophilia bacterium]|nr:hypothetical protein [Thermoleophilia bacterium]